MGLRMAVQTALLRFCQHILRGEWRKHGTACCCTAVRRGALLLEIADIGSAARQNLPVLSLL